MTSDIDDQASIATQAFFQQLEKSGFFDQISTLETALTSIVKDIQSFSEDANKRQQESENMAAHILATEAIISALLKKIPVEDQDLITEIERQAINPTVETIARNLIQKSRDETA